MTAWSDVWPEHLGNATNYQGSGHGFVEGPGNHNPWTEELGIGDAAYCAAGATRVAAHHGVDWGADAQIPHKGIAYSPDFEPWGKARGAWVYDHASRGQPCDLVPGDIVTYSWSGGSVADHTETVVQVYADDTFDTIGYNTGSPEGCHWPVRRDRKYLLGRLRMQGVVYTVPVPPAPVPTPTPVPPAPTPTEDDMLPLIHLIPENAQPGDPQWLWNLVTDTKRWIPDGVSAGDADKARIAVLHTTKAFIDGIATVGPAPA